MTTNAGNATLGTDTAPKLIARGVNFEPILGDSVATAAKIKAAIENAAADGVNLIVFPEMALQGFEKCQDCKDHGGACERHLPTGEYADGPLMTELADVVKRHDMYAVIGFGERDPVEPVLYNAAALLGPEGLIGTNRKLAVGSGTAQAHGQSMFAPGKEISVFPTRYGPIGVGICYDVWMTPEVPRLMVLKGARIIAVPTATVGTTGGGELEMMVFARARENVAFVISANLVKGSFDSNLPADHVYTSQSCIAGPQRPSMARILARTDDPLGVVTAEIDLAEFEYFQSFMHFRERRTRPGYDAHLSEIIVRDYAAYAQMTVL